MAGGRRGPWGPSGGSGAVAGPLPAVSGSRETARSSLWMEARIWRMLSLFLYLSLFSFSFSVFISKPISFPLSALSLSPSSITVQHYAPSLTTVFSFFFLTLVFFISKLCIRTCWYRVAPSCLVGWYSSGCSPGTFFQPAQESHTYVCTHCMTSL